MTPTIWQCHHRSWWVFGVWIRLRNKNAKCRLAHIGVPLCTKKARMSKSKIQAMLIIFFVIRRLVHNEFLLHGTTTNAKFYDQESQTKSSLRTIGNFTMIIRQPRPPASWTTSWPFQRRQRFPSHSTVLTWLPHTSFCNHAW